MTISSALRILVMSIAALASASCANGVGATPSRSVAPIDLAALPQESLTVQSMIPATAVEFPVTSPDLANGKSFPISEMAGPSNHCSGAGADQVPRIRWGSPPVRTKSLAVTMFDPDAASGSGLWHWIVWNIPPTATSVGDRLPPAAVVGINDMNIHGYVGPCPPPGDAAHHYRISVLALDTSELAMPDDARPVQVGLMMHAHIVGFGQLTATAQR
ncbi:YbhB/YbcL family Raf kinase inhibitor-like protein [Nocardia sp. NEAU-G5]|uniref:YbhB/YbcL family Raf kinase inhibitor-like protein n=1 Tax=Nocardia albiluteola TaxID=2842303 RepID=A0ABS6BF08_9NOCA|nr:YbhB/YbcL family Raf kinase inhibitor-like protein [Nocardia albiluteola]MBU3068096.1 YbhB/YbcL family Raf kinase inhibitor-like protein [Nocardia albiluteola]